MTILGLFSPIIGPYNPQDQQLRLRHQPPFSSGTAVDRTTEGRSEQQRFFLLGTDHLGRDYLSRLFSSFQVNATIGLLAWGMGIALALVLLSFPGKLGSLPIEYRSFPWSILNSSVLLLAALGIGISYLLFGIISLTLPWLGPVILPGSYGFWPIAAFWAILIAPVPASLLFQSVVRGHIAREATSVGIITRESLLVAPVSLSLAVLISIFMDYNWSFLGFGLQPPQSSLGLMMAQGRQYVITAWWVVVIPSVVVFTGFGAFLAMAIPMGRLQPVLVSPAQTQQASTGNMELASIWGRTGSLVVDLLLLNLIKGAGTYIVLFLIISIPFVRTPWFNPISSITTYFLWAAYFILFWSRSGQTPGMKLFNIRVLREDGSRLSVGRATLRLAGFAVGGAVVFLGLIWAFFNPRKQGWHDQLAGTLVVKTGSANPESAEV
jgi:peptide/nickel transport system permease protein